MASIGERLFASTRTTAFDGYAALVEEVDVALVGETDDHELGLLHLARAIALQGFGDATPSAQASSTALQHLRVAGDAQRAAFAAAIGAVFTDQTGDLAGAIDLAVDSMIALDGIDDETIDTIRARYAIAGFFFRSSAFDLAFDLVQSTLDAIFAEGSESVDFMVYSIGYVAAEGARVATDPDEVNVRCELAERAARWLIEQGSGPTPTRLLSDGLLAEVELVKGGDCADIDVDAGVDGYDAIPPDAVAWHKLVRGSVAFRQGDVDRALALLDEALPGLEASSDSHCIVRAYQERAAVKSALGDHAGAAADSLKLATLVRTWHLDQIGRFAQQALTRAEFEGQSRRLAVKAERLEADIERDALTGVHSRHWLRERLDAPAADRVSSVAMLDVDNFKVVNDSFGHSIGDEVLVRLGAVLRRIVGDDHRIARFGGEEFVVLINHDEPDAAVELCEQIRTGVESHDWTTIAPDLAVTVSVGVSTGMHREMNELLSSADRLLLQAKRSGRNRVESLQPA